MLELLVPFLVRFAVSLHPYSGKNKPPMFGDYEAQRHWMEITYNLPIKEWYFNTTNNDLMYWGLDYPPLTAYHSFICGFVAASLNPEYVELYRSRGFESENHKLFMRYSVFLMDLLIFVPAIYLYFNAQGKILSKLDKKDCLVGIIQKRNFVPVNIILTLLYPGLILIDYGHFQYNCVSLGLFVLAVTAILKNNLILGSIFFCSALSFKQMELYHSFPFFFYILAICYSDLKNGSGILKLIKVVFAVVITFMVLWFPFITDFTQLLQVFHRIFPVARGVFEDKVSNIWCVINIFYKLKLFFDNKNMATICALTTLASLLPSSVDLLFKPSIKKFQFALINSSLSFFLFSFQVHEKSIILSAIPVIMIQSLDPLPCFWFLIISTFSLLHLMIKDQLLIAFASITLTYLILISLLGNTDMMVEYFIDNSNEKRSKQQNMSHIFYVTKLPSYLIHQPFFKTTLKYLFYSSVFGCIALTVGSLYIKPPQKYPDLFPLLISSYCCIHFLMFWIYFNYKQLRLPCESPNNGLKLN